MIPSFFLAHGSPMIAIENTAYTATLAKLGEQTQATALVVFTSHWETDPITISFRDDPYDMIYDFSGFPRELYTFKYPAKGSTKIASRVAQLIEKKGFYVRKDSKRGIDHGTWALLARMYPKADLPVVQVSVNPTLSPKEQFVIGEALRGLGHDNILVLASGVTVHNLREVEWGLTTPEPWAVEFDEWLIDKVQKWDLEALFNYEVYAPHASLAVPTAEHFLPLYIAMGSGDPQSLPEVIHRHYEAGSLSYLCFKF